MDLSRVFGTVVVTYIMSGVELKLIPIKIIRLKINKSTCKHMYIDVKESHLDTLGLTKGLNL